MSLLGFARGADSSGVSEVLFYHDSSLEALGKGVPFDVIGMLLDCLESIDLFSKNGQNMRYPRYRIA